MSLYGLEVVPGIAGGFNFSTRLTRTIASVLVGANDSGSFPVDYPPGFVLGITSTPVDGDEQMRTYGHTVSYDTGTRLVSYSPSITPQSSTSKFPAWASPARSRSIITVVAYIPE